LIKPCLTAAGSSLDKVIKCTVYCTDAAHFATINAV
jgi:2-iminobutanoate/2-iminopropanoate deaminase